MDSTVVVVINLWTGHGDRGVEPLLLLRGQRAVECELHPEHVGALPLARVVALDVGLDTLQGHAVLLRVPRGRERLARRQRGIEVIVGPWSRVLAAQRGRDVGMEGVGADVDDLSKRAALLGL